jgi:hypothetical protein
MDRNSAIDLKDFLHDRGYEADLYDDYSGRSMYGSETTGVTTDARPSDMDEMEEAMEEAEIEPPFRKDNMGMDYIYY